MGRDRRSFPSGNSRNQHRCRPWVRSICSGRRRISGESVTAPCTIPMCAQATLRLSILRLAESSLEGPYRLFSSNFVWTPTLLPASVRTRTFSDLHFANDLWVMGGSLPTTANSVPDYYFARWDYLDSAQRQHSQRFVSAIAYGQGQRLAVSQEAITVAQCGPNAISTALILTSPDAINWTRRDTGLPRNTTNVFRGSNLGAITWTGDEWVAVGSRYVMNDRSIVLTSPDGIIWQAHDSILGSGLAFAAWGNGKVVAGKGASLFASAPITLAAPVLGLNRSGNQLLLRLTGSIGATYDIEQTPQLSVPSRVFIQSVTLSNTSQQVIASPATNGSALWRAHRQ